MVEHDFLQVATSQNGIGQKIAAKTCQRRRLLRARIYLASGRRLRRRRRRQQTLPPAKADLFKRGRQRGG